MQFATFNSQFIQRLVSASKQKEMSLDAHLLNAVVLTALWHLSLNLVVNYFYCDVTGLLAFKAPFLCAKQGFYFLL